MKYRLLILVALIPLLSFAKDKDKEYRDIILKHDVIDIVENLDKSDPTLFWKTIRIYNDDFQKAYMDALNGKAKEAQRAIGEAVAEMHKYNDGIPVITELAPLADSLRISTGISNLHREANLDFTWSRDENAYSYPGGDIYLTWGLANRLNFEYDMLMAAYAHEITHFVLQHAFVQTHKAEKKRKKNLIFAQIISTLDVMVAGFNDGYNRANGVYTNNVLAAQARAEATIDEINKNATSCRFDYGRDQEYEADIIAYRFLEWIGIGGETYIRMLQTIQSDLEIFQNPGDTHPYTSDRIAVLQYMNSDEYKDWRLQNELKNKEKRAEEIEKQDEKRANSIAKQLHLNYDNTERFVSIYRSALASIRQIDNNATMNYTAATDSDAIEPSERSTDRESRVREILDKSYHAYSKFLTPKQLKKLHTILEGNASQNL